MFQAEIKKKLLEKKRVHLRLGALFRRILELQFNLKYIDGCGW